MSSNNDPLVSEQILSHQNLWIILDDCLFLYSWQMLISNITNIENLIRSILHVKIVSILAADDFSFSNFSDCRSNLVPFQKELTKKETKVSENK